jgi:hypothetical protein
MQQRTAKFEMIDSLLGSAPAASPVAGLLVARTPLITLLRYIIGEMHRHRYEGLKVPGTDELRRIKYWEDVLEWVKQCRGSEIVLLDRRG